MALQAAATGVRFVCFDVMVFAGVAPRDAQAAVEQGIGEPRAAPPPTDFHLPGLPRPPVPRRLLDRHRRRR
jgi:hypothetical protein